MALESGSFISDLNPANPAGTDNRSQGDDHIRLIKSTLKNTFPNVNGAVTATDEQLNAVAAAGALAFPGMIVMWSGSVYNIPSGWKLCDGVGTISTGAPVPNLVGRFIVGTSTNTGSVYNVGQTGGSEDFAYSGWTDSSNPSFSIPTTGYSITGGRVGPGNSGQLVSGSGVSENAEILESLSPSGSGPTINMNHNHTVDIWISKGRLPPYYALAFLIKN